MSTEPIDVRDHDPAEPLPADLKARLAASFGGAADGYRRFRPDYPAAAALAAIGPGPARVLDLGAGTGKLTAVLHDLPAGIVRDLVAVEPDPQMLAALRAELPNVDAHAGSAEQIPLPDASVDVIVVGQAMHWFDLDVALPECARVLRDGGRLAGLWNVHDDDHPFTAAFQGQLNRHVRPSGGATGHASKDTPESPFSGRPDFTDPQLQQVRWTRPMTVEQLHGLVDTLSYVITARADRRAALHAGIDELAASWGGRIELAETCEVWVATRR